RSRKGSNDLASFYLIIPTLLDHAAELTSSPLARTFLADAQASLAPGLFPLADGLSPSNGPSHVSEHSTPPAVHFHNTRIRFLGQYVEAFFCPHGWYTGYHAHLPRVDRSG